MIFKPTNTQQINTPTTNAVIKTTRFLNKILATVVLHQKSKKNQNLKIFPIVFHQIQKKNQIVWKTAKIQF